MTVEEKLSALHEILSECEAYERAIGKMSFDMECCAPPDGMEQAGEDMAILGKRLHELTHSAQYERLVTELYAEREQLEPLARRLVELHYRRYQKTKGQTAEFSYEFDRAANLAYGKWLTAKQSGDYALFRGSFAEILSYTRRAIDLYEVKQATYYDTCLDDNEPGCSIAQLDAFFDAIKKRVVPLLRRIVAKGKPVRTDFLTRRCDLARQEAFSRTLLEAEGLQKSKLVLMTTEHPFTTNFGPDDVRVTTHYYEDCVVSNIFSTLHEGGHALFMQNEPSEFYREHVSDSMSNAMHETISRFYENLIGRSEAFVKYIYPQFCKTFAPVFDDVSEREFYEAINAVKPSLIRTESDELTYSLHILIRYELEKAFVNGEIAVDDVPAEWNKKYFEYLGVTVPSDTEGCLQDVHWTSSYGYFPSYALGNAYGVQILRTMEKEFDVYAAVERGELHKITAWLKERVFSCASLLTPDEWIRKISGEPLNVDYFLDYLEEKYTKLYEL